MEMPSTLKMPYKTEPALRTLGLPSGATMRLITTSRAFHQLARNWQELEENCHVPPTVFQSYDWIKAWVETHLTPTSDAQLFVVVGYLSNHMVFAMPMCLSRAHGIRMLTWASQPIGQYGDVLCHTSANLTQWTNAAVRFIKNQRQADILRLRHVRATSNIAPHAKRHWHDAKLYERAPAMDLTRFATEADYDARYESDQRRRRKRIRAKLEKIGAVKYEVLHASLVEANIDQALDEKRKWLTERGRFSLAFQCPHHAAFLKAMATKSLPTLRTITTRLSAGDQPVSWEVGFVYQGTQYQYLTAHMSHMTDLSPGRLAFDLSQRQALAAGVKTYDLMIPYDPHKESWASSTEPVNDYYIPLTTLGAAYGHIYVGWLRPMLRKVYVALPKTTLQKLQKLLHY